jgi:hypothetical protein
LNLADSLGTAAGAGLNVFAGAAARPSEIVKENARPH